MTSGAGSVAWAHQDLAIYSKLVSQKVQADIAKLSDTVLSYYRQSMADFAAPTAVISQQLRATLAAPSPALQLQIKEAFAGNNTLKAEVTRSVRQSIVAMNTTRQLQETLAHLQASLQRPVISSTFAAALYRPVAPPAALSALAAAVNRAAEANGQRIAAIADVEPVDDAESAVAPQTPFELWLVVRIWSFCVVWLIAVEDWLDKQDPSVRKKYADLAKLVAGFVVLSAVQGEISKLPEAALRYMMGK
jgi:hypothetical protein